jgi:hypothetical protein
MGLASLVIGGFTNPTGEKEFLGENATKTAKTLEISHAITRVSFWCVPHLTFFDSISAHDLVGGWAIYNTARYFIAFTVYDSEEGQIVSLALGLCTGISFALLAIATIFSFFKLHLLMHSISLRFLTLIITSSLFLSSLTLVTPAIVNMVMLFVWRNSSDQELSTETRCRVDIDVIWSGSNQLCSEPYGWGALLAFAATRLGITAVLIVSTVLYLI